MLASKQNCKLALREASGTKYFETKRLRSGLVGTFSEARSILVVSERQERFLLHPFHLHLQRYQGTLGIQDTHRP